MKKIKTIRAIEEEVLINIRGLKRFKTNMTLEIDKRISNTRDSIFKSKKYSFEIADSDIILEYFQQNAGVTPKQGDIFLIETIIDEKVYEFSSYIYNENEWIAIDGNIDGSRVILKEDITMAGEYDRFGNYTKPLNGTSVIKAKGMFLDQFLKSVLTKTIQPQITSNPSVSGFVLNDAKPVEAGTKINETHFGTAVLNKGSYSFGPLDTGVTVNSYKVDRICDPETYSVSNIATEAYGTDNNIGNGFTIGDGNEPDVIKSLKYKITVDHTEGAIAKTNTGEESNPQIQIKAGTKTQQTSAFTPFRSFFYGSTTDKPEIDSTYVRTLINSNKAYSSGTITINVKQGDQRVAIACISGKVGVKKVINETALNADVTNTFVKSTVMVNGANGYTPKEYNIWVFEPAVPYGQSATLKVTLG